MQSASIRSSQASNVHAHFFNMNCFEVHMES
jgi:hypothetical protein